MRYLKTIAVFALLAGFVTDSSAGASEQSGAKGDPMSSCPMHAAHMREQDEHREHRDAVDANGDRAMGFSHEKTTHHFRNLSDGGAIEVSANDPADAESRDRIRTHLRAIAKAFTGGRFDTPSAVHGRVPPGVPTMERHKADIEYAYEQTELGALVRITTRNADALDAVHDFLRFQIADHETGDPIEIDSRQ